jgi:hypothetical protein
MTTTLVFPASTPDGWTYIAEARLRGEQVIPAASVAVGEVTRRFGELVHLPYIHDDEFEQRFVALLRERKISRILSPVAVVHRYLEQLLNSKPLDGVTLIGESPIKRQVRLVDEWLERGWQILPFVADCAGGKAHADALSVAALMRQATAIYGESDSDKLAAMIGIFADVPKGDVVEIGSLMGRTAFMLLALARRHGVGPVLVMDPWNQENSLQHDSPKSLQAMDDDWGDHSQLASGFLLNLIPFAGARPQGNAGPPQVSLSTSRLAGRLDSSGTQESAGTLACPDSSPMGGGPGAARTWGHSSDSDFNYLRMPAHRGHEIYRSGVAVKSKEFGSTGYTGKIAVLHIDGNHDHAEVRRDCALWLPHLSRGGWLILDDYVWAHGDGPKRTGDELLKNSPTWDRAFVAGKALFLHLAS